MKLNLYKILTTAQFSKMVGKSVSSIRQHKILRDKFAYLERTCTNAWWTSRTNVRENNEPAVDNNNNNNDNNNNNNNNNSI